MVKPTELLNSKALGGFHPTYESSEAGWKCLPRRDEREVFVDERGPSVATIAQLATDSFQGQVPIPLEEHIESCDACQFKLERLRHNDLGTDGASPSLPFRIPRREYLASRSKANSGVAAWGWFTRRFSRVSIVAWP